MHRWLVGTLLAMVAAPLLAGEPTPAVVLRIRSLESLQGQGKQLIEQIGLAKAADQLTLAIRTKAGPRGLEGVDDKRPLGLFLHFAPEPSGALLVPVSSEKAFLDLLARLDVPATPGADGLYSFAVGVDVHLKFAGNYAWIAPLHKGALSAKLDPEALLGRGGPLLSARIRADQIPKDARQAIVAVIEARIRQALEAAAKENPDDRPGQKALITALYQTIPAACDQILQDGKDLTLEADLDAQSKELMARIVLQPNEGTELASALGRAGQRASVFAAAAASGTAFVGRVNVALPASLTRALTEFVEEGFQDAEARLTDPMKKKQSQELLAALKPTLAAGELDAQLRLVGPAADQKLGFALGVKAAQGDALAATIRELIEDARKRMTPAEQARAHLDADSAGAVKIHRFDLSAAEPVQNILGDPKLSVAFRPDAMLFAIGAGSLQPLKELAASSTKADAAPVLDLEFDVARLVPLLAPADKASDVGGAAFKNPGDGRIHLTARAGRALEVNLTVRPAVLRFLAQTREAHQRAGEK